MNFTYETVDVKRALAAQLKEGLAAKGYQTMRVITADPATPAEVPCICVNRLSDDESNQSMGDYSGDGYDPLTKTSHVFRGTFFTEAVEVRVWHTNSDERDAIYQMVKGIMIAYRMELASKGVLDISLRGGKDEQDATMENAPFAIYWGTITMSCLNPFDVDITEIVQPISDVDDLGILKP